MLRKRLRGQGLTEFAVALPLLLAATFLVIETGRILQAYVTVQNAAREGARYAVTGQGGETRVTIIKQAAKDILGAGLPLMADSQCPNYCCGNPDDPDDPNLSLPDYYCIRVWSSAGFDSAGTPGERVQVEVAYNVRIITPLVSAAVDNVPVKGRVEMINEPFGPTAFGQAGVVPPTLSVPDTPTPTSTPVPITINEPLYPGDTIVAGHGDPGFDPLVQIWDWVDPTTRTLIGSGQISPGGAFRIGVSPPLVAGHTIRAVGSYGWDDAVVLAEEGTGSITVQKNGGLGFDPLDWTFRVMYSDGTTYILPGGGDTLTDLPLGQYYITESGPLGWHLEDISGADCVRVGNSAEVVLTTDGQSVGCTFTNAQDTGSLTVLKSPANGALPTDWFFTVDGPDGYQATGLSSGDTLLNLPMGTYTVTESTVAGWYLQSVQGCYRSGQNSAITSLAMHDHSVTCSFTNAQYAPSISIEKFTNGADADDAPGPHVLIGEAVTWEYDVKNTGDYTLSSVAVTDTQGVDISCPKTTLVADESMICSADSVAAGGQYENIGGASGEYEGIVVTDTDASHYFGSEQPEGMRVNCGDNADYVDPVTGYLWEIDPPYSAGYWGYLGDVSRTSSGACSALSDLYNSYDSGQFFSLQFDDFTPGIYRVTLYMVEPSFSLPGSRIFSAAIEEQALLEDFDILGQCGVGPCEVCSRSMTVAVSDGQLNIDLSGATIADEAILSAILIEFLEFLPPPTPTPTPTLTPTPVFTPLPTPALPPDLTITELSVPAGDPIAAWTPVTVTTSVFNDSTGAATEFFWTDLYVYTDTLVPQLGEAGLQWKGLNGLDPLVETTLVYTHTFINDGTHYVYTQVDSFQFVNESDEGNNISQPLTVTVYYDGPTPTPTATPIISCDAEIAGTVWAFVGGQLVVPSGRVDMSLYDQDSNLVDITQASVSGGYLFDCVPQGSGYTVTGLVEIGGILYLGSESGIAVSAGQVLTGVDIILYPLY